MTRVSGKFRTRMLITTAMVGAASLSLPASAQLITPGDLVDAVDSIGNTNQINVSNPTATTARIDVLAPAVVANWTRFNVPDGTSLNVVNASAAARAALLNRVVGATSSDLGGTITASGVDLWVLNENGILFGKNTAISANSFVASTLGVSNADFFDGDASTQFSGASTARITGGTGTTTFATDGSMWFVSQGINVNGTFSSTNETVSYIVASDVTVGFTPGSPLTYVLAAGSSLGSGQKVSGSVTGAQADFVMLTDASVMNALLQVDASVNATSAAPSANGIYIFADNQGAGVAEALVTKQLQTGAGLEIDVKDKVRLNADATAGFVDISAGSIGAQNLTSTTGAIDLLSDTVITMKEIDAATAADLAASGNIITTRIDAGGLIKAASSGGALQLGIIDGQGAVDLDAATTVTADTIDAVNAIDIDAGTSITTNAITSTLGGLRATANFVTFNGKASAIDVSVLAANRFIGQDITAVGSIGISAGTVSTGNLDAGSSAMIQATGNILTGRIDAGSVIDVSSVSGALLLGSLDAGGLVDLSTSGRIVTGTIDSDATVDIETLDSVTAGAITSADALTIGALAPVKSVNFLGDVSSADVTIDTVGALTARNITATTGAIDIGAGSIGALDLEAGTSATLLAVGNIVTTGIDAEGAIDVESTTRSLDLGVVGSRAAVALDAAGAVKTASVTSTGALTVGATRVPTAVTFTGNISSSDVTIDTSGVLTAQNITAGTGAIGIAARSLTAQTLDAGTTVTLLTSGKAVTTAIDAEGAIDAESTTGALDLGAITSRSTVALDAATSVTTGGITSTGALTVGATRVPATVTFTGDVASSDVTIDTSGILTAQNITATTGAIDVQAASLTAQLLDAGTTVTLLTSGNATTTGIDADGLIDVESTAGALNLGVIGSRATVDLDAAGSVTTGGITSTGALTIGATRKPTAVTFTGDVASSDVTIDTSGALNAQNITATTGAIDVQAASLTAQLLDARTTVTLLTSGNATTTGIDADGAIDVESTAGALDLGIIGSRATVDLDAAGSVTTGGITSTGALTIGATREPTAVTFTGDVSSSAVTIDASGLLTAQNITATTGAIDIETNALSAQLLDAGTTVTLLTVGNATTTGIDAEGAIDVESTAGALDLGIIGSRATVDLDAAGSVTTGGITSTGALTIGATREPTIVTFTGDISSSAVAIDASGLVTAQNITATTGAIDIEADALDARLLDAGAAVTLLTVGNVTTTGIDAEGAIDVESTAGALNLGVVGSRAAVDLDAAGSVTTGGITSTGALTIGATREPTTVTFTGDVSAAAVTIDASDLLTARNITATTGAIDIEADALDAQLLDAGTMVTLLTVGNATTTGIDAEGKIDVESTAGALNLGAIGSRAAVDLDAAGSVTTGGITSTGALTIGATREPTTVTFTGDVSAAAVTIDASDLLTARNITATTGAIDIEADALDAQLLDAGTMVTLLTVGNVTTTGIDAEGKIDVESTAGALNLGAIGSRAAVDLDAAGSVTTGGITSTGALTIGATREPTIVTFTGDISSSAVTIDASGLVTAQNIAATTGAIDIEADALDARLIDAGAAVNLLTVGNVTTTGIDAEGAVDVDSTTGALDLGVVGSRATVNLDTPGSVRTAAITSTGALTVGAARVPASVSFTGDVSSASVAVTAVGSVSTRNLTATTGAIAIDTAGPVGTLAVTSAGALRIGNATTKPTSVTFGGDVSSSEVTISAVNLVQAQNVTARTSKVTVNAGSLSANLIDARTTVTLLTVGNVTTTGIDADGAVDVDSTAGALELGVIGSRATVDLDATGAIKTAAITSTGALEVGTERRASSVTFTDAVLSSAVTVKTSGLLDTKAVKATSGDIAAESAQINLRGPIEAKNAAVKLTAVEIADPSIAANGVGIGDGTGIYSLDQAELDSIDTANLSIDAGNRVINVGNVNFDADAGRTQVLLATTDNINVVGKVTMAGTQSRTLALGDPVPNENGAERTAKTKLIYINTANTAGTNAAVLNLGQSTLALSAKNIVAGTGTFMGQVSANGQVKSSDELAVTIVGNANSGLYVPAIGGASANEVYLTAGRLIVRYDNAALFQNSGLTGKSTGVNLGSSTALDTLQILPNDAKNAFALFGLVNELPNRAAAIAGPTIIQVNGNNETPNSRVNGCIIGSGAGCLTTIIGTIVTDLRTESFDLLSGGENVDVPFDPLVGTNNEGLFSDVSSEDQPVECPKDNKGLCIVAGEKQ